MFTFFKVKSYNRKLSFFTSAVIIISNQLLPKLSFFTSLFTSHVFLDLFTFREHYFCINDINLRMTSPWREYFEQKIKRHKFSKNIFNKKETSILDNFTSLFILIKFRFTDICIIIIFLKKSYFPVVARNSILY